MKNRAFLYGDGLFETIKVKNGKFLNFTLHYERLIKGMQFLEFDTRTFTKSYFYKLLNAELSQFKQRNLRLRITFFRNAGGLYNPTDHTFSYQIDASALDGSDFKLNDIGLKLVFLKKIAIQRHELSNYKTLNALPYVLGSIEKERLECDEGILLNDAQRVVECTASNIFIVKNNIVYTPELNEGCLDGTMRRFLIQAMIDQNIEVQTTKINLKMLIDADELFLSNAIQGIRWVANVKGYAKQFENNWIQSFFSLLDINNRIEAI